MMCRRKKNGLTIGQIHGNHQKNDHFTFFFQDDSFLIIHNQCDPVVENLKKKIKYIFYF